MGIHIYIPVIRSGPQDWAWDPACLILDPELNWEFRRERSAALGPWGAIPKWGFYNAFGYVSITGYLEVLISQDKHLVGEI